MTSGDMSDEDMIMADQGGKGYTNVDPEVRIVPEAKGSVVSRLCTSCSSRSTSRRSQPR